MSQWQKNLYVLFLAELLSITGFAVIFPFLSLYVNELGASFGSTEFWAGMVFSAQALTMAFAAPIWGSLADRFGRKVMVQRAQFGGAVMLVLMAQARSAEQLVLLRAIQGVITGTIPAANALIAASAPRQRIGYAMGLMQMGVWLGASIGPLLGGVVADAFGFRTAFYITAVCLFLAGIGVTLFVHEEFEPVNEGRFGRQEMLQGWLGVLRAPHMPEILSMRFLVRAGQSVLMPFLPLFVATLLTSQERVSTVTGLAIGVSSAFGALSSVYLGRLGDRAGYRRLLLVCALAAAAGYVPMALVGQAWQLVALYAVVGSALGGVVPAVTALMTHAAPEGQMGAVYGLDSSVNSGGRMIAPLVGAALIGLIGLRGIFVVVAAIFVVVAFLSTWLPPLHPLRRK